MATKTASTFLELVRRSGLVSDTRKDELLAELDASKVDTSDAMAIARALVDAEAITKWQAEKLLKGKHKGFFLGNYRLLDMLGKGGMGAVYLAEHERMRRRCAIKVLPTKGNEESSIIERFEVEAQAAAALDHPNIVRAYDIGTDHGGGAEIHYLVMEYVEGKDIQQLVRSRSKGWLDYVTTAEYIRQAAKGLAHAHEAGLVHRDIKPANLLVDKKGVVKILDLGLARFNEQDASLTAAHNETVLGTADYLSPEQALDSHDVNHLTDIYSLGCTAYFMLTGHPPFPEGSVAQRLIAHQVKQPAPITKDRPDAPPSLVAIIEKMMEKKPERRQQSAEEVAADFTAWLVKYGDDGWKTSHADLTGDSAYRAALSRTEPTSPMAAATADTQTHSYDNDDLTLDLSDDGEEETPSKESKEQSAVAKEPSAESLEPAEEVDTLEEVPIEELEEELEALDAPTGFGDLDELDFPAAQLGGEPLSEVPAVGSADSNVLQSSTRLKPGSGSHRGAASTSSATLAAQSQTALSLPVIIAAAVGATVVLVLVILLLTSTSTDDEIPIESPPNEVVVVDSQPDTTPDGKSTTTPEQKTEPVNGKVSTTTKEDVSETPSKPPVTPQPDVKPEETPKPDPNKKKGSTQPKDKQPAKKSTTPKAQTKQEPSLDNVKPEVTPKDPNDGAEKKEVAVAKVLTEADKQQLFAKATTYKLAFEPLGNGDSKDVKASAAFRNSLQAKIVYEYESALESLGFKPSETADSTMIIKFAASKSSDSAFYIFEMAPEFAVSAPSYADSPITVWSLPRAEIGRFAAGQFQRIEANAVKIIGDNVKDLLKALKKDYRTAVDSPRSPGA